MHNALQQPISEAEILLRLKTAQRQSFHEKPLLQFDSHPARPAAVLIPLTQTNGEWQILFTRRANTVEHHKGQVSFPGGATDSQDTSAEDTALRESKEEIGLLPGDVRLLGRLNNMLTITNFYITPVVGVFPWPYTFKVHTVEVGRVFTIPLAWLSKRENWLEFACQETGQPLIAYLPYDGELLWGATARMTIEFLRTIQML